jgi:hypothetical protein
MNSFQELNAFGATPVDYLDARPSGVVFNRQPPLTAVDQEFDAYASLIVTPTPGIEIEEIINYQTANVRYRVSVKTGSSPLFTGSTIAFGTFNSGVTMIQAGDVYTVSGIHSVSDWDSAKNFTWTLPVAFASYPQWYLECTIIYYNSTLGLDVEMTWEIYDDRFYNVAALSAVSSITAFIGNNSPANAALTSTAVVYANPWNQVVGAAAISTEATFACEGNVNVDFLNSVSSMTINAVKTARITDNLAAVGTMTIDAVASAINLDSRTYLANVGNAIFSTNTPQVDSLNPADTFSIVLSSALGYFAANSTDAPTSTVTISGSEAVVNAAFSNVYFYPTKGSSTSGTFSWAQSRNGTLEFTKTITLTGIANAFAEVVYTYTNSTSFTPTRSQVYYGFADIVIVGAGGRGGYNRYPGYPGGGGGAGGYRSLTNQTLSLTTYTLTVGQATSGDGGNTTAFGLTSNGGQGGGNRFSNAWSGGYSGSPTTYNGYVASTSSGWGGGGGAGAGGNGGASTSLGAGGAGGLGVANGITGTLIAYSQGGGGGAGQAGQLGGDSGLSGQGGDWNNIPYPPSAAENYGDGGGGMAASLTAASPTDGKSGVVIIKIHA